MFMRLVTPSTRRLLDGVGRDGRANVKVFARCKRAIDNVRPKSLERRAPRDRLVKAKGSTAVGARDHEHIVPSVSRLVTRAQRRPHARDGRVAVDDSHSSAGCMVHRFGNAWSSMLTAAAPAAAKPRTVRRRFDAPPNPVSPSTMSGTPPAARTH